LASLVAGMVLLPAGPANAWWDGPNLNRSCDPQEAYLIEYGFLDCGAQAFYIDYGTV